jgi:hypothetical protein
MIESEVWTNIQIRFAEHISSSERQGLLAELNEIGATQHGVQDDYVLLRLGRAAKQQYVIKLLSESEKAGRLVWEMKRD